jgi:hypothetical protein
MIFGFGVQEFRVLGQTLTAVEFLGLESTGKSQGFRDFGLGLSVYGLGLRVRH